MAGVKTQGFKANPGLEIANAFSVIRRNAFSAIRRNAFSVIRRNAFRVIRRNAFRPPPDKLPEMFYEPVSTHFFETLGARLQHGRTFNQADVADHPQVVIINESTARTFWPNESPIGKRISNPGPEKKFYEIVGVVNDLAFPGDWESRTHALKHLSRWHSQLPRIS